MTEPTTIETTTISSESDAFVDLNEYNCGQRMIRRPKIINGTNAVHGHYPWMVSLMLNHRHHCGGSLINKNWILTAAHCVYQVPHKRFQVKLGGYIRNKDSEPTAIIVNEVKAIPHPGFNFATFADDLALIRLSQQVSYSNYIQPICLPKRTSEPSPNKAMVIGWGKMRQGGLSADILQEVEIPIVDNSKCINWYREMGKILTIRPTQICAGLEEGGKDACQGDSGSPMLIPDNDNKRSTVIGIVSAGIGCALPKLPGLYTRVSAYLLWIQKTMEQYDRETSNNDTITQPINVNVESSISTTTANNVVSEGNEIINIASSTEQQPTNVETNNSSSSSSSIEENPNEIEFEHNNLLALITPSATQRKWLS